MLAIYTCTNTHRLKQPYWQGKGFARAETCLITNSCFVSRCNKRSKITNHSLPKTYRTSFTFWQQHGLAESSQGCSSLCWQLPPRWDRALGEVPGASPVPWIMVYRYSSRSEQGCCRWHSSQTPRACQSAAPSTASWSLQEESGQQDLEMELAQPAQGKSDFIAFSSLPREQGCYVVTHHKLESKVTLLLAGLFLKNKAIRFVLRPRWP